jgi:hypothetical protein
VVGHRVRDPQRQRRLAGARRTVDGDRLRRAGFPLGRQDLAELEQFRLAADERGGRGGQLRQPYGSGRRGERDQLPLRLEHLVTASGQLGRGRRAMLDLAEPARGVADQVRQTTPREPALAQQAFEFLGERRSPVVTPVLHGVHLASHIGHRVATPSIQLSTSAGHRMHRIRPEPD